MQGREMEGMRLCRRRELNRAEHGPRSYQRWKADGSEGGTTPIQRREMNTGSEHPRRHMYVPPEPYATLHCERKALMPNDIALRLRIPRRRIERDRKDGREASDMMSTVKEVQIEGRWTKKDTMKERDSLDFVVWA